jgi:hypothetical protein
VKKQKRSKIVTVAVAVRVTAVVTASLFQCQAERGDKCVDAGLVIHDKCVDAGLMIHDKCVDAGLVIHDKCVDAGLMIHDKCVDAGLVIHGNVKQAVQGLRQERNRQDD